MGKKLQSGVTELKAMTEIVVRFSEADPLGIAWHGNYVKYFEDAREAFGQKYILSYLDILENGYVAPLVKLSLEFRQALKYTEKAVVEITYINSDAAKIIFRYKVKRASNGELVTTGETVQVFVSTDGELSVTMPEFYKEWKKSLGLTDE